MLIYHWIKEELVIVRFVKPVAFPHSRREIFKFSLDVVFMYVQLKRVDALLESVGETYVAVGIANTKYAKNTVKAAITSITA